jgi:uncharacterized protein
VLLPANEADDAPIPLPVIDGAALVRAFAGGAAALRQQAAALNAINVFPVPDGDTGTNMSSTMSGVMEAIEQSDATIAAGVAKGAAEAALMSAKGNSGVILSQILAGISTAVPGDSIDAATLADALARARAAAYRVVSNPREGTILTAVTDAAVCGGEAARAGATADAVLAAACEGARAAVARTPELLPVLKEAGVVDAGAQGLLVFLEGMLRGLRGEEIGGAAADYGSIDGSWLSAREQLHGDGAQAGFCTEFVVNAAAPSNALDPEAIRAHLQAMGDSLLVVGDAALVRVHLHTAAPDDAIAYARSLGTVSHEKADDIESQFLSLAARAHNGAPSRAGGVAVVTVGVGDGIEALLRSIGAAAVVRGGQTMNPSAGEIRAAIEATGATDVVVLPNNKNVILAAELAAKDLPARVRVVPSRSIPQGVAAIIALNPEASLDDNAAAMEQAIASVRTGEVTRAARRTQIRGKTIEEEQPIGLVDGDLVVSEPTIAGAVRACVAIMVEGREAPLITLYAGEGEGSAAAGVIADALRSEFSVEVEVVVGGQPHYPYLIGVE